MDSHEILFAVEYQEITNFLGVFATDEFNDLGKNQRGVLMPRTILA